MWREIKQVIDQHSHFLLTTHLNPDGDGIGAACALTELLLQLGKTVRFVCDSPIPTKMTFLDYHGTFEEYSLTSDYSSVQAVIVLDTHRKERIGRIANITKRKDVTAVCIDHHQGSEVFTKIYALDPNSCSVGAMVYTLYKEMGFDLNIEAATGVYTSIICDTGRFSYSSTSRKAHKIADTCIKLGVDPDEMHSRLFQHLSLAQVKMFACALDSAESHLNGRIVIQQLHQEDYVKTERLADGRWPSLEHLDLEYIHEFNKQIDDVACVVLLREISNNEVRISLRSMSDLDVGQIVGVFGGGGHNKAAGATCQGSLDEVKKKVLSLLEKGLDEIQDSRAISQ